MEESGEWRRVEESGIEWRMEENGEWRRVESGEWRRVGLGSVEHKP